MFKVNTKNGERFLVQLTGPRSFRFDGMYVTRGGTLTVTRRTRDYLVKKTGFFSDFDPTPEEPVDEIFPPQFGEENGPSVDDADFDMVNNPPLTQEQAMALAAKGNFVDQNGKPVASDDPEGNEKGDLTANDLPKSQPKGGTSASKSKATATAKPKSGSGGAGASKDGDKPGGGVSFKAGATTVE